MCDVISGQKICLQYESTTFMSKIYKNKPKSLLSIFLKDHTSHKLECDV